MIILIRINNKASMKLITEVIERLKMVPLRFLNDRFLLPAIY
jgi:hypothetical protein